MEKYFVHATAEVRSPFPHQGFSDLEIALKRTGKAVVCKGHGWSQEHIILNLNAMVDIYIILYLHAVSDNHTCVNIYIFTNNTICPNNPVPLHLQKAFLGLGYAPGSLPVVERVASQSVCLPIFPELTEKEISYVIETVNRFFVERV